MVSASASYAPTGRNVAVHRRIRMRLAHDPRKHKSARCEEEGLAIAVRPSIMKLFNANRDAWLRRERAFLKAGQRTPPPSPQPASLSESDACSDGFNVEWKAAPRDLSLDPYLDWLHPDEARLASILRLDCMTYLYTKSRIFERRQFCLRRGKVFRKTDAQQACSIDVNKASKLWAVYEEVGWLDARWFQCLPSQGALADLAAYTARKF